MPFFVLGYPNREKSMELLKGVIDLGVDALELGIPFSDPVADGPQNQLAMAEALKSGVTFDVCMEMLKEIRQYAPDLPIGLLLYYNLVFRRGPEKVCEQLKLIGVDALVCPELPIEESQAHEKTLAKYDLGCVHMVFPNTSDERAKKCFDHSSAFTYVVARLGPTGASDELRGETAARISHLRSLTDKPMVVGFGLSKPEHVQTVWDAGSNGAIVASRFTKELAETSNIDVTLDLVSSFVGVDK